MKLVKLILGLLFLIILLIVGVLGYFGFVPGLSGLMGSTRPKDLGVKATVADYNSYIAKAGTELVHVAAAPAPGKSFVATGRKDTTASFTPEEITGRINFAQWKDMPVDSVQVKITEDGTAEATGVLRVDRLPGFLSSMGWGGVSQSDIQEALKYVGIAGNPPFYLKVRASVTDNKAQGAVLAAEVGRFPIPVKELNESGALTSFANEIFSKVDGFYARSVTFSAGRMHFSGTVPERMTVQKGQ